MKKQFLLAFFLLLSTNLFAAEFAKILVPGAKCGNGDDYAIYVKPGNAAKLLVEFQGGGACWNFQSCFEKPLTSLTPMTTLPKSFLSSEDSDNPYMDSTMVYIPYCTGDVHIGKHIAHYNGKTVYHYGNKNVELSFKYLTANKLVDFKHFKDVTVWGASAGAIGSLMHAKELESLFRSSAKKTLIPDSPGLHFGETFWDKFSDKTKEDFIDALNKIEIFPDFKDGVIAKKMKPTLEAYYDWTIGFLFSTKDRVMTTVFGDITPEEHAKLLLGPEGLPKMALDYSHVNIWIQDSNVHTFLVSKKTSETASMEGVSAQNFVKNLKK